jgi:prepilin-type processing-associated H-X9-DG protein
MPINFTCPRCNAPLGVPEEYAGQHGPCPRCEATVTIPMVGAPAFNRPGNSAAGRSSSGWLVVLAILLPVAFLAILAIVGVVIALVLPTIQASRESTRQAECRNNLQRIGLAFKRYHDEHGCFPPAYLADENGKPMHSWRVLILPQLDEESLYAEYDFDHPWDSPENQALADLMPDVYSCPSDWGTLSAETSYMMLVGPGTISDGPGTTSMDEITDGKDRTIVLVETADNLAYWMEPTDLATAGLSFRVNDPASEGIQSKHSGGAHALFADGSVHFLPDSISPADVEALSTIGGDEKIDNIYLDF